MIEFHAGSGPDSQSVAIALEEMFADYRVMPGKAPLPVIATGGARLVDAGNILLALARKTGRFLPDAPQAAPWLGKTPPTDEMLAAALAGRKFILGHYTVVDMATYPRWADKLAANADIARWQERMRLRPAVGRGMAMLGR